MRDYSHIVISEGDETKLADMKLAYLTAARQRDALLDALQWASGSADFAPGGKARKGWLKIAQPAIEAAQ